MAPSLSRPQPAVPVVRDDAVASEAVTWSHAGPSEVDDLMAVLMGAGATMGEALGQVAAIHGQEKVQPWWDAFLDTRPSGPKLLTCLDWLAGTDPGLANAWLNAGLVDQRISSWHAGTFHGIFLPGRDWITSLPDGLHVEGELDLEGCTSLKALPEGLVVTVALCVNGCTSLDRMPAVGGVAYGIMAKDCVNLHSLAEGIETPGCLNLTGCVALRQVPRTMKADQLVLLGCHAWDLQLPDGADVRSLVCTGHSGGVHPDEWRRLHQDIQSWTPRPSAFLHGDRMFRVGDRVADTWIHNYCQEIHTIPEDFWDGDLAGRIEAFPVYELQAVPLACLELEEWAMDEERAHDYAGRTTPPPPIVCGPIPEDDLGSIIDGTHRANAVAMHGHDTILAWVGVPEGGDGA